ncbi:hypothetical protein VT03_17120 [Planctomyces sp. SH-PL14]|nr:hypothetical protein [Planctomyces sp. SH-PL14]AMV19620.1 hypothetical protein VT03_17120 [Planctomyces sp. SH-PL14]
MFKVHLTDHNFFSRLGCVELSLGRGLELSETGIEDVQQVYRPGAWKAAIGDHRG